MRVGGLLAAILWTAGATVTSTVVQPSVGQRTSTARSRPATLHPGSASPLAATDTALFAIAADERTILTRPADLSAPWRALVAIPGRAGGLTVTPEGLFATDRAAAAILKVDETSGTVRIVHGGAPLNDPTDLAFGSSSMYVADSGEAAVFQMRARENGADFKQVDLPTRPEPGDRIFLAGSPNGVIVAIPDQSDIYDITRAAMPELGTKSVVKRKDRDQELRPAANYPVDTIQKREFPEIRRPGRIATYRGLIYTVDEQTQQVYVFSRHNPRPVRLVRSDASGASTLRAAAMVVTPGSLLVLGSDGQVQRLPRPVIAEVNLRLVSVSEVMAAFYQYQYERGILPVRSVPLRHNVERTLREHRVLVGGYVTQLDPLLCRLNPGHCDGDKLGTFQAAEQIRVPDVNSENYIDAVSITLKGESLLQVMERNVQSQEFASFRSEERLREMNESKYGSSEPLLSRTQGTFTVPVEYVRYVAAINATDAPPRPGPLTTLVRRFEGLSIVSQEERPAMASARAEQPPPQDSEQLKQLREAFDRVLATIEYQPLPDALHLRTVKVGIAEKAFDPNHPVFGDSSSSVWLPPEDELAADNAGVASPPAFSMRPSTDLDHGTSVAALIAGRKLAFGGSGLAPRVLVVPLHSTDPAIGEDMRKAYLRGVRLFNVSAHYGLNVEPPTLRQRIVTHKDALFVVAAGNNVLPNRPVEQQQVCRDFRAYPVCWASEYSNLLVVTGTTAAGDALVAPIAGERPTPGTNWSPTSVHIAAPGQGFHAPGAGGAYVPVSGSSFAAPLVTAAAALLQAQRIVDPLQIKQRIIATADPILTLDGRVMAGRLNVRRAILDPTRAVLSRTGQQNTVERLTLLPEHTSRITVRTAAGQDRTFSLDQIKRLHKHGAAYRIVYINDDGDLRVVSDLSFPTPASSRFKCVREDGSIATIDFLEWEDYVGPVSD